MGRITELRLRDVRCFAKEQSARVARITILVGPNSAGKSTFLGCYETLAKLANLSVFKKQEVHDLDDENHFDDDPFHMGTFESIVRSGCKTFTIAGLFENHCHTGAAYSFTGRKEKAPIEQHVCLDFHGNDNFDQNLSITRLDDPYGLWRFDGPNFRFDLAQSMISYDQISTWLSRGARYGHLPFWRNSMTPRKRATKSLSFDKKEEFVKFINFFVKDFPLPGKKPSFIVKACDSEIPPRQRLYDIIPSTLLVGKNTEMQRFLSYFGHKLRLWEDVSVERALDGRFEILVETSDGRRNLMDVGYGVHSLLSLALSMYDCLSETIFLLQQPEVHVHPKVQAELAQFMVESNHDFLIETHSEHFTDRFRICVMEKNLKPEDLAIIYFEPNPDGTASKIHNITVDGNANLLGAPESYRMFFARESDRLLGF